jgi:hypothetical protein
MNVGEEICGEWLRHIKGCDFVQYNVKTLDVQGEIDVVGINLDQRVVYGCEVAIHLVTGLNYVRGSQPDNVDRLTTKLRKDHAYLRKAFPDYRQILMLWSPVVRDQRKGSKHNQMADVRAIVDALAKKPGVVVEPVINERFQEVLDELRRHAGRETKEMTSTVMRFLQVEEHLRKHLGKLERVGEAR